jgi:rhodanese-related sulfurtransferase
MKRGRQARPRFVGTTAGMADTETPTMNATDVAAHIEKNDIFVLDLRPSKGHTQIYGAIRYDPQKLLDAERLVLPLPKTEGLIVLYDEHGDSKNLEKIAERLREDGYASIHRLEGGFRAWTESEGRTEDVTIEQPVPLVSEHQFER